MIDNFLGVDTEGVGGGIGGRGRVGGGGGGGDTRHWFLP